MSFALYLHIPFCSYKCPYCDFNTYALKQVPEGEYVNALLKELKYYLQQGDFYNQKVSSIYFGGGTPSLICPENIAKILNTLSFTNIEITLEANPGEIDFEQLQAFHQAGINRISLGAQSLNNKTLASLGRRHFREDILKSIQAAKKVGIENINIDLIFAAPEQRLDELELDLKDYLACEVSHISCYELTIEKGTPFYQSYQAGILKPASEDLKLSMYRLIRSTLKQEGYQHYEISNFALPGFESRHNQAYWQRKTYLGIGAGAHSFLTTKNKRWSNFAHYNQYIEKSPKVISWQESLSEAEAKAERTMLSLRTSAGITLDSVSDQIRELEKEGLLEIKNNVAFLSEYGQEVADSVFELLCT